MRWLSGALAVSMGCGVPMAPPPAPEPFTVVTYNTGTSEQQRWTPDSGYGPEQAALSDQHYGDGLAFQRGIDDVRTFLSGVQPDVVGFQEIFHSPDCAVVPAAARPGYICETWQAGGPTVAQEVLGAGYQVACHLGKPDKCVGVKRAFGRLRGCDADLCLEGLAGASVVGCGKGSRVGRGVIELARGGTLTVVHVHGSSGVSEADQGCRVKQFEQVFEDLGLGDGPAVNGVDHVVLGDFNTDPGRLLPGDVSAVRLRELAGPGKRFQFVTPMGPSAPGTYGGLLDIDHVLSDAFTGSCWAAGVTPGRPPVSAFTLFDHVPQVCTLSRR